MIYVVHDGNGKILGAGKHRLPLEKRFGTEYIIEHPEPINPSEYEIVDGAVVKKSQADLDAMEEDEAWWELRSKRNRLLEESGWTQLEDSPVNKQAWAQYRQELRDLPANTSDPRTPSWPIPPK